jgi:hypothetical protein
MTARNWLVATAIVMTLCVLAILLPFAFATPPVA